MQETYGYADLQRLIDNGSVWHMEGSMGRAAMSALECGACMLPKVIHYGAYGNRIPSRDELVKGTKGTFQNSVNYYERETEIL